MATAKPKKAIKRKAPARVSKKKKRGISKFQVLVVAGVLALIGVVAVVASRASGTPNYQYSWNKYCVSDYGKDSPKAVQNCKNTSAEALVYRLYRGMYNRAPQASELQYWTQQLAGDRTKATDLVIVDKQPAQMGSDTAFVKALYANMLLRPATAKEVSQWVGRLKASGDKKWGRDKVAVNFAISGEAIRKNQTDFSAFAASVPAVTITQTAAADQRKRFEAMYDDYQVPAKKDMDAAVGAAKSAQSQLTAASASASKKNVSADDLKSIATNQAAAQASYSKSKGSAISAEGKRQAAARLLEKAQDVADFSGDIADNQLYGISQIRKRYAATADYAKKASSKPASIKKFIDIIASKYAAAEKKYESAINAAASAAATGTSDGTPAGGTCPPSECSGPSKKQGETVEQADKRWNDYCNAQPDKRKSLSAAEDGLKNSAGIVAIYDVKYTNDGMHRRSCTLQFKAYDFGTLKCLTGYHPDGPGCVVNTPVPATPVQANGKRCPDNLGTSGYFTTNGSPYGVWCWSNFSEKIDQGKSCQVNGMRFYNQVTSGGKKKNVCRFRWPQYGGY